MDWMNRGERPNQPTAQPMQHTAPAQVPIAAPKQRRGGKFFGGLQFAQIALLFSVTILVVAVVWFIALNDNGKAERAYIDDSKLQAVFLNGGQVYFGDITDLNGKFLGMSNIYYLRVNQQVQPNQSDQTGNNDVSLVKLGCELHGPQDAMVINREQVIFWENLKDDGQVAKAVKNYKDQNPDGQKCDASTNQSTTNTEPTTPPVAPTPPTTNTNTNNNSTNRR